MQRTWVEYMKSLFREVKHCKSESALVLVFLGFLNFISCLSICLSFWLFSCLIGIRFSFLFVSFG